MRIESLACRGAQLYAHPRRWMRIVEIDPEHERPRQADDAHQTKCRGDADARNRPEIGDNLGNPTLPDSPKTAFCAGAALQPMQNRPQRGHQIQQCRGLMPYFM